MGKTREIKRGSRARHLERQVGRVLSQADLVEEQHRQLLSGVRLVAARHVELALDGVGG